MLKRRSIKRYLRQVIAFVEKDLYITLRIKVNFFVQILNPVIQLLVLIFIFGIIFNIKEGYSIGYWSGDNYILFLLIAFCVQFSKSILGKYDQVFNGEKYWRTLSAILVAPVHRFTLLTGIFVSNLIINTIPLFILIIIAYFLFPISILFLILTLLVFFSIYLIFASIGLIIGVFRISNEKYVHYSNFILRFVFLLSCTNYPKEIFPDFIQNIIILNPFYYVFELLRLTWYLGIDYEIAISHISFIHILILLILTISSPFISIYIFNRFYHKYGITGY